MRAITWTQIRLTIGPSSRFSKASTTVGCIVIGTKRSAAAPASTPENPGGVTPRIVNGMADRRMVVPRTDGSRANRRSK
jgi:hypothetical protein